MKNEKGGVAGLWNTIILIFLSELLKQNASFDVLF